MNKKVFADYISDKHSCTRKEARYIIDMFTSSAMGALGDGNEISLVGFGNFSVSKVAARDGRNPQTAATIKIPAYNQVRFKVSQKMKDAVN